MIERKRERERVVEWIEKNRFVITHLNQENLYIYSTAYKPAICKMNEYSEPINHMNYSPTHTHTHTLTGGNSLFYTTPSFTQGECTLQLLCVCVYCGHMLF